jgi:hypothetical protein
LEPRCDGESENFFGAFSAGQTQPGAASFRFESQVDFKKGTAFPFLDCPFRQQLKRGSIAREFKLISVLQFANTLFE